MVIDVFFQQFLEKFDPKSSLCSYEIVSFRILQGVVAFLTPLPQMWYNLPVGMRDQDNRVCHAADEESPSSTGQCAG